MAVRAHPRVRVRRCEMNSSLGRLVKRLRWMSGRAARRDLCLLQVCSHMRVAMG